MSTEPRLTDILLAHLREPAPAAAAEGEAGEGEAREGEAREGEAREALEAEIARVLDDVHRRWPGIAVAAEVFLPFLARRLPADAPPVEGLRSVQSRELYLVCAFLQQHPRAAAALEAEYLPAIDATLSRLKVPPADVGDIRQVVCQKLLAAHGTDEPRIARYSGRGDLKAWLCVVTTREARDLLSRRRPETPVDAEALLEIVAPDDDQELAHLKQRYRGEFKDAFDEALAALSARDRNVLRHHLVGRLNIEQIGAIYHVHRATVARWIAHIRTALLDGTRLALGRRLRIDAQEVDSILRLIDSRLTESILSGLARTGD